MKTVVLIMRRASLAQGLMRKLRDDPGIQLCFEPDYANADVAIRSHLAGAALIEVAEDGEYDAEYCLALCAWLRQATPDCRLLLLCPESNERAVQEAVSAKHTGLVNDFVFYDTTLEYLADALRVV